MPKFELPQLPYAKDALAPYLRVETFEYHYGKHHQTYVDNLNKLIAGTAENPGRWRTSSRKAAGPLFNNAAQHWNHSFYWNSLSARQEPVPLGRLGPGHRQGFRVTRRV